MLLNIVLFLFLAWVVLIMFVITSAFVGFIRTRVPFVPTSTDDIAFISKELNVSSKDTFYDLGSGDGKVVFLVESITGSKAVGFELTWWTHIWAELRLKILDLRFRKKHPIQFENKNFFNADWSEATVIYGYLYPPLMGRVEEKFLKDCKPGTLAVIRDFPFPHLKPEKVYNRPHNHEIYVYRVVDK